jgi:inner membrane transporter RhtA
MSTAAPVATARIGSGGPGVLMAVASMTSVQLGAALAAPLFDRAGAAGVSWLRLSAAAIVLWAWARPRVRGRAREDLWAAVALGAVSAAMTICFSEAVDRIPLGVVVTIEFLGPLSVALGGVRAGRDLLLVGLAGGGVALLCLGDGSGTALAPLGVAFAGAAACGWAAYILLTRHVGQRFTGLEGVAVAVAVSAVVSAPFGLAEGGGRLADPGVIAACCGLCVLLPVLPYSLEMAALRRLPASVFGVLMSLEPCIGALLGFIVLGQGLTTRGVLAIAMVAAASAGATIRAR